MSKLKNGFRIVLESFRFIKNNPKVLFFLFFSLTFIAIIIAVSTTPFWVYESGFKKTSLEHLEKVFYHYSPKMEEVATISESDRTVKDYLSLYSLKALGYFILFYLILYSCVVFINAALIKFVIDKLHMQRISVFKSLLFSLSRWKLILSWSLLSATVSGLVKYFEEHLHFATRWITKVIGIAWSLATFFVLPVLVHENVSIRDGLRRSGQLFTKTWGERLTANFTTAGAFTILFLLSGTILGVGGGWIVANILAPRLDFGVYMLFGGLLIFGGTAIIIAICSAFTSVIIQSILYCYATEGVVPTDIDKNLMDSLWRVKGLNEKVTVENKLRKKKRFLWGLILASIIILFFTTNKKFMQKIIEYNIKVNSPSRLEPAKDISYQEEQYQYEKWNNTQLVFKYEMPIYLEIFYEINSRLPQTLDEIRDDAFKQYLIDAWDNHIYYERLNNITYKLVSFGANKKAGGKEFNKDIIYVVNLHNEEEQRKQDADLWSEKWLKKELHLGSNFTTEENIEKILDYIESQNSYNDSLVRKIASFGRDAVPILFRNLNQRDWFTANAIEYALEGLLDERDKGIILKEFKEQERFGKLVKKYKFEEAKKIILEKLKMGKTHLLHPQNEVLTAEEWEAFKKAGGSISYDSDFIDAAASFNIKESYPYLLHYLEVGPNKALTAEALDKAEISIPISSLKIAYGDILVAKIFDRHDYLRLAKVMLNNRIKEGLKLCALALQNKSYRDDYYRIEVRMVIFKYSNLSDSDEYFIDQIQSNFDNIIWDDETKIFILKK